MILSWLTDWLHWLFGHKPPPTPPPPPPTGDRRADLFAAVNAQRAAQMRPALRRDSRLDSAAQEWADGMAATGVLTHGDVGGRVMFAGYRWESIAENLAPGDFATAAAVVAAWMSDPPHRSNMLGDYRDVGVGVAVDARGRVWWCMDVATEAT